MQLPEFPYHEDPEHTGAVEPSNAICSCCGKQQGFVYTGPIRVTRQQGAEPEELCPWCVADGSAARKYEIVFMRPESLTSKDLPSEVVSAITCRTPGYSSWQEAVWLCHCGDGCVFCGDLTEEEAHQPDWEAVAALTGESVQKAKQSWQSIAATYKRADPSIFKFKCRHCHKVFYQLDSP